MTPQDALLGLLARIGANQGAPVFVGAHELSEWPAAALAAMKSQRLLVEARYAASVICPGCERQCVMPVNVLPLEGIPSKAFVFCDKRNDISRVSVPAKHLEQWQSSGNLVADLFATLLDLHRSRDRDLPGQWELGLLKGRKTAVYVRLVADGELRLTLGGHRLPLGEVLELKDNGFALDRRRLGRCVDHPLPGCGDIETAAARRKRLQLRVKQEKAKGGAYSKRVATEEGISTSRLKQIVSGKPALVSNPGAPERRSGTSPATKKTK